ncbi:hypothetical protein R5R35_006314 [Gryllus longicercus]|uniref:VPS9 domain-containing protein n=1 Tax=Gryllus longicercus TaxID=2509291 RepID=A0AAN9YZ97_9ORTH
MCDEIEYNVFYQILQNKYRKKYEMALSNCWTICIPCSPALRGIKIDKEFVDIHILKPFSATSTDLFVSGSENSYGFNVGNETISLNKAPFSINEKYSVNIKCVESGYNKDYQQYKIFVIDRPLSPRFCSLPAESDCLLQLNQKITSLQDASNFLSKFSLELLDTNLKSLVAEASFWNEDLDNIKDKIHEVLSIHWVQFLQSQTLELQREARFQKLLTTALENHITHSLHDTLFPVICHRHRLQDEAVLSQLRELASRGVTADQLGAPEDFAVPLPAAVVELASLDSFTAPIDKLFCLRTTLDLILAEVKGAIIDAQSVLLTDAELPSLSTDNLVPLLMSVIIQAKPLHMFSNLYYVEHFQWTLSPKDAMSFSVVTFQAAVQELLRIKGSDLKPRSEKVHRELGLEELIKVTGEVDEHFDRNGERCQTGPVSPLDRELERITSLIEASTQDLSAVDHQED